MNDVGNQLLLIIINKRHVHYERELIVFQWFVFTKVFIYFPRHMLTKAATSVRDEWIPDWQMKLRVCKVYLSYEWIAFICFFFGHFEVDLQFSVSCWRYGQEELNLLFLNHLSMVQCHSILYKAQLLP